MATAALTIPGNLCDYFNYNNSTSSGTGSTLYLGGLRKNYMGITSTQTSQFVGKKITDVTITLAYSTAYKPNSTAAVYVGASNSNNVNTVFPTKSYSGHQMNSPDTTDKVNLSATTIQLKATSAFQYGVDHYAGSSYWYLWIYDSHPKGTSQYGCTIQSFIVTYENKVDTTTPQLVKSIAWTFARTNASGNADNGGSSITCTGLKITMNSGFSYASINSSTSKVQGFLNESTSATTTYTLSSSVLNTMVNSNYRESSPVMLTAGRFPAAYNTRITITLNPASGVNAQPFSASYVVNRGSCLMDFSHRSNGGIAIGQFSTSTDAQAKFEVASNYQSVFNGPVQFNNSVTGLSKGYSTTEVATGETWVTGPKIYRKTIEVTSNTMDITSLNIGFVAHIEGILNYSYNGEGSYWSTNYGNPSSATSDCFRVYIKDVGAPTKQTSLITQLGSKVDRYRQWVTLEYTKVGG